MVKFFQNAKEEKTMLWDGTHDLDDLIYIFLTDLQTRCLNHNADYRFRS